MTQTNMNVELLIKLLKMTTSANDAEALSFMRKANEQLIRTGWDWEKLLHAKVTVMADPFENIPMPRTREPAYNPPSQPTWQPPQQSYRPKPKRPRASRPSVSGITLKDLGL